jgi:hypothetical protein
MNQQDLKAKFQVGNLIFHRSLGRYGLVEEYCPGSTLPKKLRVQLDGYKFPNWVREEEVDLMPKKKVDIVIIPTVEDSDTEKQETSVSTPMQLNKYVPGNVFNALDMLGLWSATDTFLFSYECGEFDRKIAIKAELI